MCMHACPACDPAAHGDKLRQSAGTIYIGLSFECFSHECARMQSLGERACSTAVAEEHCCCAWIHALHASLQDSDVMWMFFYKVSAEVVEAASFGKQPALRALLPTQCCCITPVRSVCALHGRSDWYQMAGGNRSICRLMHSACKLLHSASTRLRCTACMESCLQMYCNAWWPALACVHIHACEGNRQPRKSS